MEPIEIKPFSAEYGNDVVALILPIQQAEFDIPITLQDQPDLLDIANFYQQASGNFWVALSNGKVVGTIALLDIGNGQAALRKMFVHADFRGKTFGVAQRLLETLFAWCVVHGIDAVFLGTTSKFLAAHRFYEKNGFSAIDKAALPPAFPVVSVDSKFYVRRENS